MNTKFLAGIAVAIAFVALAFFIFAPKSASSPTTPNNEAPATSTTQNGKLNVVEICQSALAYMSFPSGAEADAFVKECIEGKHPEVITKWKSDNGITDDRAI